MRLNLLTPLLAWLLTASLQAEGFNRAELQKFIDEAVAAGGGQVILPPGEHHLDKPLVIKNAQKLRISGLDAEDTILRPAKDATTGFPLILVEGTASNLLISKITLTSSGDAFAQTPLIEVKGATGKDQSTSFHIDRCFFENHAGPGIHVSNAKDSRLTASTFMDLGGPAIHVTGATSALLIQHNHITRTATPAIHLESGSSDCRLIANELQSGLMKIEGKNHQLQDNSLSGAAE